MMGLHVTDVLNPVVAADPTFMERLEPFRQMREEGEAALQEAVAAEADPPPLPAEEPGTRAEEWRQERALLRAKLKTLSQENQALQRARTSAEHRAAHYQAQVERVREEIEELIQRSDWPKPTIMVQRLIRGMMEARRQILDLELANAELLAKLDQTPAVQEGESGTDEPS
jgi:predicted RNase H-like nuclease (RuvC/YqgF family)